MNSYIYHFTNGYPTAELKGWGGLVTLDLTRVFMLPVYIQGRTRLQTPTQRNELNSKYIYHESSIAVGSRKAQHVCTEGRGLLVGSRLRRDLFVHHIARVDTSLAWDPALEPFDVDYEDGTSRPWMGSGGYPERDKAT